MFESIYGMVTGNASVNYLVLSPADLSALDLLRSEEYYVNFFPSLKSLEFTDVKVYKNCVAVECTFTYNAGFYGEEHVVDFVIKNGPGTLLDGSESYPVADGVSLNSLLTNDDRSLYNKVMETALSLVEAGDEYETVKNIHDYLVSTLEYGIPVADDGYQYEREGQLLRSALFKNKCVCAGYAKAFYFLCRACGLDVVYVSGSATNSSGVSDGHAWNKVKVNGNWYNVDCTWDDPLVTSSGTQSGSDTICYFYFLIPDEILAVNHTWDDEPFPDAVSTDLNDIYEPFEDVEKFTSATDAYGYILGELEGYGTSHSASQPGFDFGLTLTCTDYSLAGSIAALCKEYHDTYGCGYEYHGESAGVYGHVFTFRIFKGSSTNTQPSVSIIADRSTVYYYSGYPEYNEYACIMPDIRNISGENVVSCLEYSTDGGQTFTEYWTYQEIPSNVLYFEPEVSETTSFVVVLVVDGHVSNMAAIQIVVTDECPECHRSDGGHDEDCSLISRCPVCYCTDGFHDDWCPNYVCPDCEGQGGYHEEWCPNYV